jgi:hypothetical protein
MTRHRLFACGAGESFGRNYPDRAVLMGHHIHGHPLFSLEKLIALAETLPERCIEHNSGEAPLAQDPAKARANGLSAVETLARIEECRSWLALKNVEKHGAYKRLLDDCLDEIEGCVAARTGPLFKKEAFIFVSSAEAVTPFHMDPEHNILMQIRGRKTLRLFPPNDRALAPQEAHEAFHKKSGHRNLAYRSEFESRGRSIELQPGDAAYVPVKAPHWVKVGAAASVSFSITWRSRQSDHDARLHRANAWLRERGAAPRLPGEAPALDAAKRLAARLAGRIARD